MPRGTFGDQYKGSGQVDQFDSLKFETGDYGRVLIPYDEGWYEYVHSMRAPELDDDNLPVIVNKPMKSGGTRPDFSMRFVGQRICLGDPAVLEDKKLDATRCPACAAAQRGVAGMFPERRFALPVIRYNLVSKKSPDVRLQTPPGATILVWKLSQRMYNDLMAYKAEMRAVLGLPEDYDLATLKLNACDVVLWCESGDFQRVLFKTPRQPAHQHPAVAALVKALWGDEANRPTDAQLKAACGRDNMDPEARTYMATDAATVEENWRLAERAGKNGQRSDPTGNGALSGGNDLAAGLDDLFGRPVPSSNGAQAAASSGMDEFGPLTTSNPASAAHDPNGGSTRAAVAVAAGPGDDLFGPSPSAAPGQPPADDPFASPALTVVPSTSAAAKPAATFDQIIDGLTD